MTAVSRPRAVTLLAENRTKLAKLGNAETEASGAVVDAHVEIAEPDLDGQADLRSFLSALARGEIIVIATPFRLLAGASDLAGRIVRLPVSALRQVLLADPEAAADEADPGDAWTDQPAVGGGEHRGKDYPDDR
jgi:hypothetical protein